MQIISHTLSKNIIFILLLKFFLDFYLHLLTIVIVPIIQRSI